MPVSINSVAPAVKWHKVVRTQRPVYKAQRAVLDNKSFPSESDGPTFSGSRLRTNINLPFPATREREEPSACRSLGDESAARHGGGKGLFVRKMRVEIRMNDTSTEECNDIAREDVTGQSFHVVQPFGPRQPNRWSTRVRCSPLQTKRSALAAP
jgi:hypothetical protein